MKYVPTKRINGEDLMAYAERLDRERIEHVAQKMGLGDMGGQPVERTLGKILDHLTEKGV